MWQITLSCVCLAATVLGSAAFDRTDRAASSAMTARARTTPSNALPAATAIQRAPDGLFYVTADVGSAQARFLVDTGASHVILSHADAKKALVRSNGSKTQRITTAAGEVAADWVVIDQISIDGQILRQVEAAVPHRDVGVSLLGQSALVQFSSVRIDGDELSFVK